MTLESLAALDVGGGTQDLLVWYRSQRIENIAKMVMPAPTQVVAGRIRRAREQGRAVFLHGWLMGGGAMARAVREHLEAGLAVYATPAAAGSLADDLDRVRQMGVQLTESPPADALPLFTSDLDLVGLRQLWARFELAPPQALAVAVCDHGFSPGFSNRKFRFQQWQDFLAAGGILEDLISDQPPEHMTRLRALCAQAPGVLVMDTAAAGLWGALQDPLVAERAQEGLCVVNLGNMHTVGFLVKGRRVLGIYEHHTGCLDRARLADHLERFMAGGLSDQEVFDDQGHGCARLEQAPTRVAGPVVITGPQRALARGLGWQTAMPLGDVMLSGCFGLLAAARWRAGQREPLDQ